MNRVEKGKQRNDTDFKKSNKIKGKRPCQAISTPYLYMTPQLQSVSLVKNLRRDSKILTARIGNTFPSPMETSRAVWRSLPETCGVLSHPLVENNWTVSSWRIRKRGALVKGCLVKIQPEKTASPHCWM